MIFVMPVEIVKAEQYAGKERLQMIIEYTYNTHELKRKKCFKCKHLRMKDEWSGVCECKESKVKERHRLITDRRCVHKERCVDEKL